MESTTRYALWFGLYAFASVSMVIFNKLVMSLFPYPNVLLMTQNTITVLLNVGGTQLGIFSMSAWKMEHFKIWVLPTMTFSVMLFASLKALPLVAVATTVVFRNVGTVLVAFGDAMIFGKEFHRDHKVAIGVIVGGSLVYSAFDINYDAWGYIWMTANTSIFACNVLYEKYAVISVDQTAVGVSCYQNVLSLPLLIVMAASSDESLAFPAFMELSSGMKFVIILTGCLGCLLSVCYMSLNKFASPTAITIGSNLNKLVSAMVGGLVFKNVITVHTTVGLMICMAGGYMYSNAGKGRASEAAQSDADDEKAELVLQAVFSGDDEDESKEM